VDKMTRLSIRIYLDAPGRALGPGMAELLDGVARDGSIRKAAAAMEMSYRKAWLLIQGMQETFGGAVVTTTIGGSSGGGAELTELGKTLLSCYRRIESRANRAAAADLEKLSSMARVVKRTTKKI
jgi:molybdate transport system regulatory protein